MKKFKEKMTGGFKYDMRNLLIFHPTTQKSENSRSMDYFCPKYMRFELKNIQGSHFSWYWTVMQNLSKPWSCGFKNGTRGIVWTFIRALESLKNCTLMGSFCPKHMFQLETFRRIMCHDTQGWCKIKKKWLVSWKMT